MQTGSLNNFYRRRDMTPITNPAVREAAAAMQAALKTGSEKEINQAFELFNELTMQKAQHRSRHSQTFLTAVSQKRLSRMCTETLRMSILC